MAINEIAIVDEKILVQHLENIGLIKDLTNGEKDSFVQIAKAFNLNPFKREIYASKYGGQMSIIVGYEVYIKRAERTGQLDGWECVTTGSVTTNDLVATITIYRKDRTRPFVWQAHYNECVQKTKEGNVTKFWQKASFMTKKVAISQGFRLCFSDELGGMPYTKEEMEDLSEENYEIQNSTKSNGIKPTILPVKQETTKPIPTEKQMAIAIEKIGIKGEVLGINSMKEKFMLTNVQIQDLELAAIEFAKSCIALGDTAIVDVITPLIAICFPELKALSNATK